MSYEILNDEPMPGKPMSELAELLCNLTPGQCLKMTGAKRIPRKQIKEAAEQCGSEFEVRWMDDKAALGIWRMVTQATEDLDE